MADHSERARRVLVVDDDDALREMVADYLRKSGYQAEAVGDGGALRAVLSGGGTVDLVVLDLMLPGEDQQFSFWR
jgi:DNA-binding response OmpR family regulator